MTEEHEGHTSDFDREIEILGNLSGAVHTTLETLEETNKKQEERIVASIKQMKWFRRAAVLAVFASAVALWSARESNHAADKAKGAVDQIQASRVEARRVTCERENDVIAARINALNDRSQQLLRNALTAGNANRTPEQQARAEEFLTLELAEYERIKVPLRDCSPAGLAKFYGDDKKN